MKVNWNIRSVVKPVIGIVVAGVAALVVLVSELDKQVSVIQIQIPSIEKNHDVLRSSATDSNAVLREELRDLRGNVANGNTVLREELRDLRSSLTRHYENHVKHGGGE